MASRDAGRMPLHCNIECANGRATHTEPMNNSRNRRADSASAPRLACFRRHDDGAGIGVTIVGGSLPLAITWHSSIKQERPCSIRVGNGRRVRLDGPGILRVGRGRRQRQHKRDCHSRHDGLLPLRAGPTRGDTTGFRSTSGRNLASGWRPAGPRPEDQPVGRVEADPSYGLQRGKHHPPFRLLTTRRNAPRKAVTSRAPCRSRDAAQRSSRCAADPGSTLLTTSGSRLCGAT